MECVLPLGHKCRDIGHGKLGDQILPVGILMLPLLLVSVVRGKESKGLVLCYSHAPHHLEKLVLSLLSKLS
jgi:hypothetical protein